MFNDSWVAYNTQCASQHVPSLIPITPLPRPPTSPPFCNPRFSSQSPESLPLFSLFLRYSFHQGRSLEINVPESLSMFTFSFVSVTERNSLKRQKPLLSLAVTGKLLWSPGQVLQAAEVLCGSLSAILEIHICCGCKETTSVLQAAVISESGQNLWWHKQLRWSAATLLTLPVLSEPLISCVRTLPPINIYSSFCFPAWFLAGSIISSFL